MDLSPKAKMLWDKIPHEFRTRLLNDVYCSDYGVTGIANVKGVIKKDSLILRGTCTSCNQPDARLIESE
ncbi:MAG: hypothetical protein KDK51_00635 [Deltaproteobacteria bacterium]|nr:hypothetical protein [Deltaproteobacteria bacterium]